MSLKHTKVLGQTDSGDTTIARPSDWNAEHAFSGGTNEHLLVRDSTQGDGKRWTGEPSVTSVRFLDSVPAVPREGEMWLVRSGTSPNRLLTLYVFDEGEARVFHEMER